MPRKKDNNYKVPLKLIVSATIVLAVGTVTAFTLKMFFTRHHYFNISRVSIRGADDLPYADFKRRLIGKNIFSLDLKSLKNQIEAQEENVRCSFVWRRLPGELLFLLEKRMPVAQVKLLRYHLVDNLAQIMPYASDIAFADFPVILGLQDKLQGKKAYVYPQLERAIELIKEKNGIASLSAYMITRVNAAADKTNTFYLAEESALAGESLKGVSGAPPVEIRFSLDNPAQTIRVLAVLLKKRPLQTIEYIDLKNLDSPVILEKKEKISR